jgi:molybdopterin-guanine dinucleotide biosynthesis protein A
MNFSAVILAGGKSSRMGRDKAWLEVGGQTLLARQIGLARKTGAAEIFISGRPDADYSALGCLVLKDKFTNAGPLAGIESALDAAKSPLLLVLAVDLPEMSAEFLRRLIAGCSETSGAIPKLVGGVEPLAAYYPKTAHALAVTSLERKAFAVKAFSRQCVQSGLAQFAEFGESEAKHFTNWNFPADRVTTTIKCQQKCQQTSFGEG